ncbi:DNA methyltransferase [uncultured Chryseobacterium sp.]|uniref:DNA methyltransferase n=1 Tax=uncultured Chryseobacterium sp. TaxID=259322 RepID=UPI0025E67B9B|nr:DNA methyltransferase [uncultured Chryseobacterium sp.]
MDNISGIYNEPLKSTRSGSLFMAFSYPTKISPETIALYILAHTKPNDIVLDVFGGSGSLGLAALLCDTPNQKLLELIAESKLKVKFGPRKAFVNEISGLGSFISIVMSSKIDSKNFSLQASKLLQRTIKRIDRTYKTVDPEGNDGEIRYVIHSEYLICPHCKNETSFSDACVSTSPLEIKSNWTCTTCNSLNLTANSERVLEKVYDPILNQERIIRKRRPYKIYGQTGKIKWKRFAIESDFNSSSLKQVYYKDMVPVHKLNWGDLHRSGYHFGIDYLHDFYTERNIAVMSILWDEVSNAPLRYQDSLKLWILSYNASHSTLMTRVVLKKNQSDFILTGAQPGVLYISSLPVEKNIIKGLERKIKTFNDAFSLVERSNSEVITNWGSSTNLDIQDESVNYVFTDPPFGDYIPYSELNILNEVWLNRLTNIKEEAIISKSQNKTTADYESLLTSVFSEVNRVLVEDGNVSVVFHSASSDVWNALKNTFSNTHFEVINSSILQKDQASFKQTNSQTIVKGDAVLLLNKGNSIQKEKLTEEELLNKLITEARLKNNKLELERERLYSRYVGFCMKNHIPLVFGAKEFYSKIELMIAG